MTLFWNGVRNGGQTIAAMCVLALADAAFAQTPEDMGRCRAIEDDARRLDCYDAIVLAPTSASRKYEIVPIDELKDFALSYRGRLVEVQGWVALGPTLSFLGIDADDASPMPVDLGLLERRDRQSFIDLCEDGCAATVQGRVGPLNFTTGIVADAVIAH